MVDLHRLLAQLLLDVAHHHGVVDKLEYGGMFKLQAQCPDDVPLQLMCLIYNDHRPRQEQGTYQVVSQQGVVDDHDVGLLRQGPGLLVVAAGHVWALLSQALMLRRSDRLAQGTEKTHFLHVAGDTLLKPLQQPVKGIL
jgi:hypothetical protein